jgi:hypothetical protein
MRTCIFLLGTFLLFSVSAVAQEPAGVGSSPHYSGASGHNLDPWQLAVGYQYNRVNLIGTPFNTHGVNVTVTRYFGRWFGVEGQVGTGFFGTTGQTTTPPNLSAKSIFVGGGARLAYRNKSRYEPWIHAVVGIERFRFSQTAGVLGSNTALAGPAGGGVDVYISQHVAIRAEADAFGSRFFSMNQRSFQIVGGVVLGF